MQKIVWFFLFLITGSECAFSAVPENSKESTYIPLFPFQQVDPQIDFGSWKKVPLTFVLEDKNGSSQETIELTLPAAPQKDSPSKYTIADTEGMDFKVYAIKISDLGSPEKVTVQEGMAFLVKVLENTPGINLLYKETSSDPQGKSSSAAWVSEKGQLTRLTAVKGESFIFFLETNVTNPTFFNAKAIQLNSPAFEQIKRDTLKNQAFVRSVSFAN